MADEVAGKEKASNKKKKGSKKEQRVAGKSVRFYGKGKNLMWAFNDTTDLI